VCRVTDSAQSGDSIVPTYIALLRAVNVGGKNILKMERLRELCAKIGFKNVRTYVQSGNVVFAADDSAADCCQSLEKMLAGKTTLPVSVVVRTGADLKRVIARNPFLIVKGVDRSKLAVAFLSGTASKEGLKKLGGMDFGPDRFSAAGKDVYLFCPTGFARTKLSNNTLERVLSVRATSRNWNTVVALHEMAAP
jgi:uncharacterized protein (DUF1697 family)